MDRRVRANKAQLPTARIATVVLAYQDYSPVKCLINAPLPEKWVLADSLGVFPVRLPKSMLIPPLPALHSEARLLPFENHQISENAEDPF